MAQLLDDMLAYDAANADLKRVTRLFEVLDSFPFNPYPLLPAHYRADRRRLTRSGTLPPHHYTQE